jgi:hypothetical protein
MELGNGAVAAHKQATPDLQTDLSYPDAMLMLAVFLAPFLSLLGAPPRAHAR